MIETVRTDRLRSGDAITEIQPEPRRARVDKVTPTRIRYGGRLVPVYIVTGTDSTDRHYRCIATRGTVWAVVR